MKKEELQQYQALCIEIEDLNATINKIQDKIDVATSKSIHHDIVKGSSPNFPYTEHNISIHGIPLSSECNKELTKYKHDLEKEKVQLYKQKRRAQKQKYKIQEYIYSVHDPLLRIILKQRYIDRKTWLSISLSLGSSNESYARMLHDRFMEMERKVL